MEMAAGQARTREVRWEAARRLRRAGLLLLAGLGACSTTTFKSTWKDPTAQPVSLQGQKVAAFVVTSDEGIRRAGEDALAQKLTSKGVQGIPGYQLTGGQEVKDPQELRQVLAGSGVQGAVIMRVIDRRQEVNYVPGAGPYYGSMYGYWGYGWSAVSSPGYLETDTIVSVETTVYSVPQDKLLWAGVSETVDPAKLSSLVNDVTDRAVKEMRKEGLVAK